MANLPRANGGKAVWLKSATYNGILDELLDKAVPGLADFSVEPAGDYRSFRLRYPPPAPASQGDMIYWSGSAWTLLPAGEAGAVLYHTGTAPAWLPPPSGDTESLVLVPGPAWGACPCSASTFPPPP